MRNLPRDPEKEALLEKSGATKTSARMWHARLRRQDRSDDSGADRSVRQHQRVSRQRTSRHVFGGFIRR